LSVVVTGKFKDDSANFEFSVKVIAFTWINEHDISTSR
jgi:hypothetical protein